MTGGTRMLVAMWPDWPVAAAGVASDVPAVVVASNRVVAVTAAARAEGVVTGIRRREAQGRCPRLEVVAADPGRDAREWEPVVAEVERLTTSVEVLGPGSLALVTRGPSRYFGGDVALARKVGEVVEGAVGGGRASGVGEGCRVGVADGRFAARLAARLAALPPEAVRQTKALIKNGRPDVPGRIAEELVLFGQRLRSPEAAEAFQAFMEKRKPDFSRFS